MCLILFAWRVHPRYPMVFAANRDEYLDRPAAPAAYWADAPSVLGGRDLEKGGSWFALERGGRWAAVTNFREGPRATAASRSRGALVRDYLTGQHSAAAYSEALLQEQAAEFPGFNLLLADAGSLYCLSNRNGGNIEVSPGIHGLSNHALDTPWPKVRKGRQRLAELMDAEQDALMAGLFEILLDRDQARDTELPDTGIGAEWERMLSAPFIVSKGYGTRASTVLLIDASGDAVFEERSFGDGGRESRRERYSLKLDGLSKGIAR